MKFGPLQIGKRENVLGLDQDEMAREWQARESLNAQNIKRNHYAILESLNPERIKGKIACAISDGKSSIYIETDRVIPSFIRLAISPEYRQAKRILKSDPLIKNISIVGFTEFHIKLNKRALAPSTLDRMTELVRLSIASGLHKASQSARTAVERLNPSQKVERLLFSREKKDLLNQFQQAAKSIRSDAEKMDLAQSDLNRFATIENNVAGLLNAQSNHVKLKPLSGIRTDTRELATVFREHAVIINLTAEEKQGLVSLFKKRMGEFEFAIEESERGVKERAQIGLDVENNVPRIDRVTRRTLS